MTRGRHLDRTHFRQAHLKVVTRGSSPTLSLPSINHTSLKKSRGETSTAYLETTLSSPCCQCRNIPVELKFLDFQLNQTTFLQSSTSLIFRGCSKLNVVSERSRTPILQLYEKRVLATRLSFQFCLSMRAQQGFCPPVKSEWVNKCIVCRDGQVTFEK
jgi:hypothetical protein